MEYVDVGGNVMFIEEEDEIKQSMEKLMENEIVYKEMKKIAETKGYETFSYERISKQAISWS